MDDAEQKQQVEEKRQAEELVATTVWALKNLPQRRAFEILRQKLYNRSAFHDEPIFNLFADRILTEVKEIDFLKYLEKDDFRKLLSMLMELSNTTKMSELHKSILETESNESIKQAYQFLTGDKTIYPMSFEIGIGDSMSITLNTYQTFDEKIELIFGNLASSITEEFKKFQEKYEKAKTPEECIKIQEEWDEKLLNYKAWCDFAIDRLITLQYAFKEAKFREELKKTPGEQEIEYYETDKEATAAQKAMEKRVLDAKKKYDDELVDMTQLLQEKANEFITTFEKKFRIMDKGHRLLAASADIPGMKIPNEVKTIDGFVVPGLNTLSNPDIKEPKLNSKNSIVAVVAFAFGNVKQNEKFSVSCDLGGFSTGLPLALENNDDFQIAIRASQIFTAACITSVTFEGEDRISFCDEHNKHNIITESIADFEKRMQSIFNVIVPKPAGILLNVFSLTNFIKLQCNGKVFEDRRREIFENATGCTSFIINEVTQSPNGVVRKKLTTDGDPQLPGCGTHLIEDSADGKLVSITNWINANYPDQIKTRGRDEEKWSEGKKLEEEEIKKYPVFIQRLHMGGDPHILKPIGENGVPKICRATSQEVKELDEGIKGISQDIEELNRCASGNQTIRQADAPPLSDIKGYAHEADSYDIPSRKQGEGTYMSKLLDDVLESSSDKKPRENFRSMLERKGTRYRYDPPTVRVE